MGNNISQSERQNEPHLYLSKVFGFGENNHRIIIQEAFAAKIPLLASDVGGIPEFVEDGVNGLLFERGNVKILSKQLQRVFLEPYLLDKLRAGIKSIKSIDKE